LREPELSTGCLLSIELPTGYLLSIGVVITARPAAAWRAQGLFEVAGMNNPQAYQQQVEQCNRLNLSIAAATIDGSAAAVMGASSTVCVPLLLLSSLQ